NFTKPVAILERGVWFVTPERAVPPFIAGPPTQPYQYWPRPDNAAGLLDFISIVNISLQPSTQASRSVASQASGPPATRRTAMRPSSSGIFAEPLYNYTMFDEVDVISASGVGGGSLIYSNVSLEPYLDPATHSYPVMKHWPIQLTHDTDYVAA